MALSEQTAVVVSLATSLALLALLLACVYRRHYRRLADNFRVSLDRRELDLQLLEHRFKQQARPVVGLTVQLRRHKSATEDAFAELVCPITFSLPVDPVIAEDGKVYERSAIEEWLKQQHKSPVTNLAMGTKLLPALQVKNMIRTMVTSGALTGEMVDLWKLKLKEEEKVAEGLAKDFAKAFEWYEKSHEAGDASGTDGLGWCYLHGEGVPKCPMLGATLLSQAAERGSKAASCNLGRAYAKGIWGFPKNEKMARRYYSMVASASIDDCTGKRKEDAATWLREHQAA